jgi:carbonic anhydrase
MDAVLEKLRDGVRRFRSEVYPAREQMYARAAIETQRPHTLFIA